MRAKIFLGVVAVVIAAVFVLAPLANARTIHCKGIARLVGVLSETNIYVDDTANHKLQLVVQMTDHKCTCEEFPEFRQIVRGYYDMEAGTSRPVGYYTNYLKGGEKHFGKWSGKTNMEVKKDGSWEIFLTGEWEHTGGTGIWKDAKGKGTVSGKITPTGFDYTWEGDFELPD
jgi:hypothetical protein